MQSLFLRRIPRLYKGICLPVNKHITVSRPIVSFRPSMLNKISMKPIMDRGSIQVRGMANHRHKKFVRLAKGYGFRTNSYKMAKHRVDKARQYAYRSRKVCWCFSVLLLLLVVIHFVSLQMNKRNFRTLWIQVSQLMIISSSFFNYNHLSLFI